MSPLLIPPLAFLVYVLVGVLLMGVGRALAGSSPASPQRRSTYASGEAPPPGVAAQGYSAGFVTALYFGVLHLGVLVVATSGLGAMAGVFVLGLCLGLVVLWLE
jgi:hypothetical protein